MAETHMSGVDAGVNNVDINARASIRIITIGVRQIRGILVEFFGILREAGNTPRSVRSAEQSSVSYNSNPKADNWTDWVIVA